MQTIASHDVPALAQRDWFNLTQNSYYAGKLSVYAVQIKQTVNGDYFVDVEFSAKHQGAHSIQPSYRSNPLATEAEARELANKVWAHYRDSFITEFGVTGWAQKAMDRPEGVRYANDKRGGSTTGTFVLSSARYPVEDQQTLCPKCESFGTLTTTLLAYGNDTNCSHCGYNSYFSIGD